LIEQLQKHWKPDDHVAAALWSVEDVFDQAENNHEPSVKLTREQAEEIIDHVDRKQDASLGITWDTLDAYIDDYERINKEEEEHKKALQAREGRP
jgi:hypothetical protein